MAQFWRGLGRLSSCSAAHVPRNWIAAAAKPVTKISNNNNSLKVCLLRRTFASEAPQKPFGGKKSLSELYVFDGIPPSSFTLVYKADLGKYFVTTQTFLWLGISACCFTLLLSIYESLGKQDEAEVKERAETARREREAANLVRKGLVSDKSKIEVKDDTSELIVSKPGLADLYEKDLGTFGVFLTCLIALVATCTKLLRTVPVRVYIGKKGMCVGAYYGSLLPGRIIRKEFVAGTLTTYKGKPVTGDSEVDGSVFKTANGDVIVLFDQFFRTPADFNYILDVGIRSSSGSSSYDPSSPNKSSPEDLLSENVISAFDADDPRKKKASKLPKK